MNLVPGSAFSIATVMIWSSCLDPVPPILNLDGPAALTASRYSFAVLYGVSALTQSTNWSSASIATGVRSFQLNGTPVASGVVNRLESVMMILLGSPLASLTARKPSAPAPPDLLTTISGCFIRLFLVMTPCSSRAIWSAPPPVPAGTMNSTGLVGSQPAAKAGIAAAIDRQAIPAQRCIQRRQPGRPASLDCGYCGFTRTPPKIPFRLLVLNRAAQAGKGRCSSTVSRTILLDLRPGAWWRRPRAIWRPPADDRLMLGLLDHPNQL